MLRLNKAISTAFAWVLSFLAISSAASAQFSTVGTATSLGGGCYQLISDPQCSGRGAIWSPSTINITNGFDITFQVKIVGGADGMAFVLQSTGPAAIAVNGGNTLGYANTTPGPPCPGGPHSGGISPSFAVELDIFDNVQANTCILEMNQDHIAIVRNGDFTSPLSGPVCAQASCAAIDGNFCRAFRIRYVPSSSNLVEIYYNGALRLSTNYNIIANIFSGNPNVYFGMTGSCGGISSTQTVCYDFASAGADTVICAGTPLNLTGTGGTSYTWSPGIWLGSTSGATVPFTHTVAGPHPVAVSVTNTHGCTDTDTVNVTVEANPTVNAGPNQSVCAGDSVLIGPANNNNYTYSWSPSTGLSSTGVAQPMAGPGITTNYTVTVVDTTTANGCFGTDAVQVAVNPNPVAIAGADTSVCEGDCAQLGIAPIAGYIYSWSPVSGGINPNIANPVACPLSTTTYTLVTTDGTTLCDDTASVTITVNPNPVATILSADTSVCLGMSVNLLADSSGGDNIGWTPSSTLTGANTLNPVSTPNATTEYFFTVTNTATGCSATDSITIGISIPDPVNITSNDTFICNVDTVQLNSTSGAGIDQWSWTPTTGLANPSSPNTLAFPTTSTTYILTGTNSSTGCQAVDSVRIDVFELNLTGLANDSICRGDTVTINVTPGQGSGNYQFTWTAPGGEWISDSTIGNPMIAPTSSTFFVVTVTDLTSTCSDQGTVFITVSTLQASVTPAMEEINPGQYVELHASDGDFYSWTPSAGLSCDDCQDPIASPTVTTTYTVTVSDSTGCSGEASMTIVVDSMIAQNVFTPNGDGYNDLLFFNYLGTGEYEVFVFDRWGTLIFSTSNPEDGWNGKTKNGQDAPEGVYYVLVKISDDDAIPDTMKNTAWSVTLIR